MDDVYKKNAALVSEHLSEHAGFTLAYDEASIEWLEGFIERQRSRDDFDFEASSGLSDMIGCFLGEGLCANFGGEWRENEEFGPEVAFPNGNSAFPLNKTKKNFLNGTEAGDSILGFYRSAAALSEIKSDAQ